MKNLYIVLSILISTTIYSQMGLNTSIPKSTLDIVGETNNPNKADAVIAPKLTLNELIIKKDLYTTDQIGCIVYITNSLVSTETEEEIKTNPDYNSVKYISNNGYYYFNGVIWKSLQPKTGSVIFIANYEEHIRPNQISINNTFQSFPLTQITNIGNPPAEWDSLTSQFTIPISGTYILNANFRRADEARVVQDIYINVGKLTEGESTNGIWVDNPTSQRFTIPYSRFARLEKGDKICLYSKTTGADMKIFYAQLSIVLLNQHEN